MGILTKQSGFSMVEIILVLVILGLTGFIGYSVYTHRAGTPTVSSQPPTGGQPTANNVSSPPQVNSASNLDQAQQTLDQNDPTSANTSDSLQLNSQLSGL